MPRRGRSVNAQRRLQATCGLQRRSTRGAAAVRQSEGVCVCGLCEPARRREGEEGRARRRWSALERTLWCACTYVEHRCGARCTHAMRAGGDGCSCMRPSRHYGATGRRLRGSYPASQPASTTIGLALTQVHPLHGCVRPPLAITGPRQGSLLQGGEKGPEQPPHERDPKQRDTAHATSVPCKRSSSGP